MRSGNGVVRSTSGDNNVCPDVRACRGACALVLGQVAVLEAEVALLPLAPRAFPVEVDVHALLVLLRDRLRLRMPLEPRQVLDVETP